jgi:hypothetical protein
MDESDFRAGLGCLVFMVAAFFMAMFFIIVIAFLQG